MKSSKKICEIVRLWALEICKEDDHDLFQKVDGVIPCGGHIDLHIRDKNDSILASINVSKEKCATVILLTDDDKPCFYTLRERDGFEPIKDDLLGFPDSEFFTSNRIKELSRRLNDLPEIKEEKCKADNIKLVSDPNKRTILRPDSDIVNKRTTLRPDSDIVEIVRRWACDICHESKSNLLHRHDTDGVGFDIIRPVSGFYRVTVVVKNLGNGFEIVITDIMPGGVAHVMCKATGEVDVLISGSFKLITHEQVNDLVNRLKRENSTPVKSEVSFSLPKVFTCPLNKIKTSTLTHDVINKTSYPEPGWDFDITSISDKYDVLDADAQYRRRINYLLDKFRRLTEEYGRAESALSKIPNIPLEEYCTRKFPIRRKLVLPTIETIDGKTVIHFKVDDLSERVIKKYSGMWSIPIDAANKELDSKNSMFELFEQGTCTRPRDEVLCYAIENMASRNPYGIRAVPNNARNYCSFARIHVLLNLSSDDLKEISTEEIDDMAEYLRSHDSLVPCGGGSSVNGILASLMNHINKEKRTLERDVVVINNSYTLQAAVKITQLMNMVINCDVNLGWMKRHKSSELEIDDPTLVDKVVDCLNK